jgi:hypothetical protein
MIDACGVSVVMPEYNAEATLKRTHEGIPFEKNSDDFLFDNQIILQIIFSG